MKANSFNYSSTIKVSPKDLYNWHEDKEALTKLMPRNLIDIIKYSSIAEGNELHFKIKVFFGILKINWVAKIENVIKGKEFSDLQIKGPFKYWYHRHIFLEAKNSNECIMKDKIDFLLPGGFIINFLFKPIVIRNIKSMFKIRHSKLRDALERD